MVYALPMAELLVVIRIQDPAVTVGPELAELVCTAAIEVADRLSPRDCAVWSVRPSRTAHQPHSDDCRAPRP